MNQSIEQRVCLKFCVANGFSCANSLKMLEKAYGESVLSKTRIYEWYKAFKEGREIVEDNPRSGRPSTSSKDENIEKVKEIVLGNRHSSLREIARELNLKSHESIRSILVDKLGMRRIAARLVPKELNFLQQQYRKQTSLDMLDRVDSDPTFIERIITGDETWVYEFDMQTSQQASEWRTKNEPKPKKPRQSRSKVKVMLIVFFDIRGLVHHEFVPEGLTVNKEYYLAVLKRLREKIRQKRPELWINNSWIFHDDNAPSHRAAIVTEFKAKNATNTIDQPPYSPDLAPSDYFLFPKLKLPLRGTRFESIESIKENSWKELKAIPENAYKKCFEDWKKRWRMCVASNGDYFEGDKINIDD